MRKALVIYGPTVTGKTSLAIKLAKKFNGEIISCDSRQIYKGLDIGAGKVTLASKAEKHEGYWIVDGVKINGFDLVNPSQFFSAANFIRFAQTSLIRISEAKKLPIIVGGTGFYLKALVYGIDSLGVKKNQKLRQKLEKLSKGELYKNLLSINPQKAKSLNESDRQNPRRLIRVIEIALSDREQTSTRYQPSPRAQSEGLPVFDLLESERFRSRRPEGLSPEWDTSYQIIGLTAPNQFLYQKADDWLDTRLEQGMIEEVRRLMKKVSADWLMSIGLEYKWISRYLLKELSLSEAEERLRGEIHALIRRQKTWFNQFKGIKIYDITLKNWQTKLEKEISL